MNKYIKYLLLLLFFSSCEEVIEKKELDAVDNVDVWNKAELANLYLNDLYRRVMPGFSGGANANLSDESTGSGTGNMMYGLLTIDQPYGTFNIGTYNNIRRINILLTEIEGGSISREDKDILIGQALFLRAWVYWQMVLLHGGVPMILEVQDHNSGEALYVERDPAAKCVEIIVRDLNNAIQLLPASWPGSEYGRITRAAAAAFKGRVLLFYASPQFNPNNLADRWTAAYEANKEARQIAEADGYGLYPDFADIFLEEGNKEAILVTIFDGSMRSHGYENGVRPASVSNTGSTGTHPTWTFVQAFPMKDGRSAEDHPEYDPSSYWVDRDPRFYSTVAYNGDEWIFEERRQTTTRQWTYLFNDVEGSNNTSTGFYLRKNINTSLPKAQTTRTPTDWIEIRFAEVLLNLAESANEAGNQDEAYSILKAIRERAGIEPGAGSMYGLKTGMTKEEMRKAVMLERQIELAFENKRHWDLRRRNLFTEELNGTRRKGIQVSLDLEYVKSITGIEKDSDAKTHFETQMRETIDWSDPENHELFFNTEYDLNLDEMEINFLQPKYNFYYIPQTALDKDPKIKQTIGWVEGDYFDPLAP